jgi:hypothetical protein
VHPGEVSVRTNPSEISGAGRGGDPPRGGKDLRREPEIARASGRAEAATIPRGGAGAKDRATGRIKPRRTMRSEQKCIPLLFLTGGLSVVRR